MIASVLSGGEVVLGAERHPEDVGPDVEPYRIKVRGVPVVAAVSAEGWTVQAYCEAGGPRPVFAEGTIGLAIERAATMARAYIECWDENTWGLRGAAPDPEMLAFDTRAFNLAGTRTADGRRIFGFLEEHGFGPRREGSWYVGVPDPWHLGSSKGYPAQDFAEAVRVARRHAEALRATISEAAASIAPACSEAAKWYAERLVGAGALDVREAFGRVLVERIQAELAAPDSQSRSGAVVVLQDLDPRYENPLTMAIDAAGLRPAVRSCGRRVPAVAVSPLVVAEHDDGWWRPIWGEGHP